MSYCESCGSGNHNEEDHLKFTPCEKERERIRRTFCQKPLGHKGSCMAVIFWEEVQR